MLSKFLSHTKILESGCIIWGRALDSSGYGTFSSHGKKYKAHRWIYSFYNGDIPKNMCIDHTCRNRACVNIQHLRMVTWRQNAIENSIGPVAINAAKTHCPSGHEYNADNTYIYPNGRHRTCKICSNVHNQTHYENNKEKIIKRQVAHHKANKDARDEYLERYRERNREEIKKRRREDYLKNKEKIDAQNMAYYWAHKPVK